MATESCNKEKEALAEAQKELRHERFKWKMIVVGVSILAFLLLISTLYFWMKSRGDSSAAPTIGNASPEVATEISSVAATEGTSISPELR